MKEETTPKPGTGWVRSKDIIEAHDRAIVYVVNWWEQNKGRALVPNVTGDPYGIDLYNDTEFVHVNYRTESGIWKEGPFPYPTLRELVHKIRKYKELKKKTGKPVYITHIATDYSRIILTEVGNFDLATAEKVKMPSETAPDKYVPRWICFSKDFEESPLPEKKFEKIPRRPSLNWWLGLSSEKRRKIGELENELIAAVKYEMGVGELWPRIFLEDRGMTREEADLTVRRLIEAGRLRRHGELGIELRVG